MSENMIDVKNLNTYFNSTQILKNININIKPNTVTALIGPSGCGKSTFLRTLNKMNNLTHTFKMTGEITIDNEPLENIDDVALRKKVGMVFQKANPFPKSIYENIAYGLRIHGMKDEDKINDIVIKTLKDVALYDEIKDDIHRSAYKLSGGQQQRLCIARSIAVSPKIILMDEPCSALDPISTLKIEDLIYELKKDYTIIIVTHNMQQATRVSDNTAFFLNGEIIEIGDTNEIFLHPKKQERPAHV